MQYGIYVEYVREDSSGLIKTAKLYLSRYSYILSGYILRHTLRVELITIV